MAIPEVQKLGLTSEEQTAQSYSDQLEQSFKRLLGESSFRTEQEQKAGIAELTKQQSDLTSRLKAIQNEALAIPLQLQQEAVGRGITAGGLAPIQMERLRANAIQALTTNSLLEASRGNLTTALDLVDRAVAQRFDPEKEKIAVLRANLDIIRESPAFTVGQKNRAAQQQALQDARGREIAKQESDQKTIYGIALKAQEFGADVATSRKILEAKTPEEALLAAGSFLRDPEDALKRQKLEAEIKQIGIENRLKLAENEREERKQRIFESLGGETPAERSARVKAEQKEMEDAKTAIPILEDKVLLIDSILDSPGLATRVGVFRFQRRGLMPTEHKAAGQNFSASVHQLAAKEFVDAILAMKKQGGTLGALNEQEGEQLRQAATKLNDWEIKRDGKGIGEWEIDEESFKREVNRIKNLTNTALTRARGNTFSTDEQVILNELEKTQALQPGINFYSN